MQPVIGTAGWAIDAENRPSFPSEGSALQRYASVLPGVEVNSSFHRPHRRSTWERWGAGVPEDFRFAAKIPKEISHARRLADSHAPFEQFMSEAGGLGPKFAVLLLQLPPSLVFDEHVAASFFTMAASVTDVLMVCEPRHPSWFEQEAGAVLEAHRVARVAADPAKVPDAALPGGWRGMSYIRLHGSPVMYRSAYGEDRLRTYAAQVTAEMAGGRQVWCMFDNTASSAALGDALALVGMVEAKAAQD
ncbi:DUF72 domain-containing protein [Sphingomonas aerophila]|jgi:uncharacterized protein YecE (DUF72 family)|uniref:Uncharacterized protein YecE (DUF72 family) n=1 Tax=Sphingomonas aerophila TaxID=1344948 RepID=A0A7W9BEC9_9SPHN|nr:DUF72 domain-containing protein [Sphingomonas aerophila]MBB5715638.1 uncharacterized protein YecE (DUF72 family) [Sphingomonas aerophila]